MMKEGEKASVEFEKDELEVLVGLVAVGMGRLARKPAEEMLGVLTVAVVKDSVKIAERVSAKIMKTLDAEAWERAQRGEGPTVGGFKTP